MSGTLLHCCSCNHILILVCASMHLLLTDLQKREMRSSLRGICDDHVHEQVGPDDLHTNALLQLLVHMSKRDAFNTLRTQQQVQGGWWVIV